MTVNPPLNAESYRLRVISRIKDYFAGDTLLDAGCGEGEDDRLMLQYFKKIHGSDIEERANWKDLAGERLTFSTGNAEKMSDGEVT